MSGMTGRCFGGQLLFYWLYLCYFLWFFVEESSACEDSYHCRLGQHCCEDNNCKPTCHSDHKGNVAIIIGIVTAVAVGNVLFWVTFCCLCWCQSGKKHSFRYRPFSDKQTEEDIAIDDDDRRNVSCDAEVDSRREEIELSGIVIKNPNTNSNSNATPEARQPGESSSTAL